MRDRPCFECGKQYEWKGAYGYPRQCGPCKLYDEWHEEVVAEAKRINAEQEAKEKEEYNK